MPETELDVGDWFVLYAHLLRTPVRQAPVDVPRLMGRMYRKAVFVDEANQEEISKLEASIAGLRHDISRLEGT